MCRYPSPDKTSHTPPRQQWRGFFIAHLACDSRSQVQMTGVITWVIDCGDGVCIGGKHLRYQLTQHTNP